MKIVNRIPYKNFILYIVDDPQYDETQYVNLIIMREHDDSALQKYLVYNYKQHFMFAATVAFTNSRIIKDRYTNFMNIGLNGYDDFIDKIKKENVKDQTVAC